MCPLTFIEDIAMTRNTASRKLTSLRVRMWAVLTRDMWQALGWEPDRHTVEEKRGAQVFVMKDREPWDRAALSSTDRSHCGCPWSW